jgi:hypothetical protein
MNMTVLGICIFVAVIVVLFASALFLIAYRLKDISEAIWTQNRLFLVFLKRTKQDDEEIPEDLSQLTEEE